MSAYDRDLWASVDRHAADMDAEYQMVEAVKEFLEGYPYRSAGHRISDGPSLMEVMSEFDLDEEEARYILQQARASLRQELP